MADGSNGVEDTEEKYPTDSSHEQASETRAMTPEASSPIGTDSHTQVQFSSQTQSQSQSKTQSETTDKDRTENDKSTTIPAVSPLDNLPAGANLWEFFLHQTSGQKRQEGHLIVLGNAGSGKTELVSTIGRIEGKFGEMKRFLMMRYAYIYMSDPNSDAYTHLLNVWQVSSPEHCAVFKEIIPKDQMHRLAWMIVLDCSQPHMVKEEFDKWIQVAVKTQESLLARCDAKSQGELKDKIYEHVQYYSNPNDTEAVEATEDIKVDVGLNRSNPSVNIGAPLIVVLNKVDMMKTLYPAEAQANSQYEILTQYVRLWCLDYAATSFSMSKGLKEQGKRIASYLEHRVFGGTFNRGPSAVVSLTNLKDEFLFIPSGFDSKQILENQANTRSLADPFDKYFPLSKNQSKSVKKKFVPQANVDSTFLKEMSWALDNAKSKDPSARANGTETTEESTAISSTNTEDKRKKDAEAVQKFFTKLLESSTG